MTAEQVSLGSRCDDEMAVVLWLCLIEGDNDDYLYLVRSEWPPMALLVSVIALGLISNTCHAINRAFEMTELPIQTVSEPHACAYHSRVQEDC
jgi:hypothetical protein